MGSSPSYRLVVAHGRGRRRSYGLPHRRPGRKAQSAPGVDKAQIGPPHLHLPPRPCRRAAIGAPLRPESPLSNSPSALPTQCAFQDKVLQQESMAWGGLFLSFGRPSQEQQKSCLAVAGGFNYDAALQGASRPISAAATLTSQAAETSDKALAKRGFFVNRSRVLIGSGSDTFLHAKSALLSWGHLALGWATVQPDTPVKVGTRFCICYKELIPWVMLPLQIAYVKDGNAKGGMFAFGSGTLQGHLLAGEERFSVQLDEEDRVWYEVFSFSKPAHILSALCYPYVQLRQKHFARQSGEALLRHVAAATVATRSQQM
ncbi:UPF0548 protein At2g17695-like isoform X2 [Phragmites australis]|uniref:UPF0548 protein At2g17695-like isoform X2 n=1 Tax=Phragmites australis TaxID=29695 RepID=UPI002D780BC1|nr:UPF0548 protein At2g17695-like isoform X2 [Phragmites australis]